MSAAPIGLSGRQLGQLFPFHFAFDRERKIVQVGQALQRVCPALAVGASVGAQLELLRPAMAIDFDFLRQREDVLLLLRSKSDGLQLRGQILWQREADVLLFLGVPPVSSVTEVESLGLSLADFPPHQMMTELLFLLRSKDTALAEATELAARLREREERLRATNAELGAARDRLVYDNENRRAAEIVAQQSEARLRAIMDSAADGIITADEEGIVLSVNAAAARIFGYAESEIVGRNVACLMPSPYREQHDDYMRRYLCGGEAHVIGRGRDVMGQRRDGSCFPLHLAVSEARAGGKRLFVGMVHDLSERERMEHDLRDSEERLRLVIDTALDAVITIDADGAISAWNAHAETIFGWRAEEVMGRPLSQTIIPPTYRQAHEEGLRRCAQTGEGPVLNRRIEITAIHRSGREFPVELAIAPLRRDRQTIYSAFVRDITERRQAEQNLAQAKDAAEAASKAKSLFLATMSHEIRTPLNPIIGLTGLLLDEPLPPGQRQHVERIRESSLLLLQRINEVLDFSRVEAGRVELEEVDFHLRASVQLVCDLFLPAAAEKGIRFTHSFGEGVPDHLRGDPARLQQVLSNLISNALKFTTNGEITVVAQALRASGERLPIEFRVYDTGIGIAADKLGELFDPFTQADASTTRRYGGSGLGLAIAKGLVERMGGEIGVDSRLGRGSCFWFRVPFLAARSSEAPGRKEVPPQAAPPGSLRPLRVLLAEDNSANQEVLLLMLTRAGQRADVVGNGAEAVNALREAPYDLVLMDCQMPEMDGFEATRRIRAGEAKGVRVPIVAMTALTIVGDRERCFEAGMDDYLPKPVEYSDLVRLLAKWANAKPNAAVERAAVDPSVLAQLDALSLPGQPKLVHLLIDRFLENGTARMDEIEAAVSTGILARAAEIAHDMKTDSGNLGARVLSSMFDEMQEAARREDLRAARSSLGALRAELVRAMDELRRYRHHAG